MKRLSLVVVRHPAKHTTYGWRCDSHISLSDSSAYDHSATIIVSQTRKVLGVVKMQLEIFLQQEIKQ